MSSFVLKNTLPSDKQHATAAHATIIISLRRYLSNTLVTGVQMVKCIIQIQILLYDKQNT